MNSTDIYATVTERMIKQLETGAAPWRRTWSGGDIPRNLITKKPYRGVNAVLLSMSAYASPYWLTFNQARDLGGNVRKGERSELIIFWKFSDDRSEGEGSEETVKRRPPVLKYYRVFNAEQCEGLEKNLPPQAEKTFSPVEAAARIIDGIPHRPEIRHEEPRAFYAPVRDFVNLPRPETFDTADNYYAVAFHELTHWTGHASRLNREGVAREGRLAAFGSADYSKEELIAELGSAYLCAEAGINSTLENSAAYLQNWLDVLKSDYRMIVTAASHAQKAADFIIGRQPEQPSPEDKPGEP